MAIKLDPFDFVIQVCEKHDELANENAKICPYCVIDNLREDIKELERIIPLRCLTDKTKH